MPAKKYHVRLTAAERTELSTMLNRGRHPARTLMRARILLKTDVGTAAPHDPMTDREVATAVDCSTVTVQRVRQRFCQQGLPGALERSAPDRVYERRLDGEGEALLIALACSEPPEGRSRWTLRLLADTLVELDVVETISHETVRKTLKKTRSGRTSVSSG
jgi:transposase